MRDKPEQVSGFKLDAAQEEADDDDAEAKSGVYARFCDALQREVPDIWDRARLRAGAVTAKGHDALEERKQGLWDTINASQNGEKESGFSFGFGDGDMELDDTPW